MVFDYLRHIFISSDDTGICESVLPVVKPGAKPGAAIVPVERRLHGAQDDSDNDESDKIASDPCSSPDIHVVDIGYRHRPRSSTETRLESIKKSRNLELLTEVRRWGKTADHIDESIFQVRDVKANETHRPGKRSMVSKLLEETATATINPFRDYAKFDLPCTVSHYNSTKQLHIFIPFLTNYCENPMDICIDYSAKIADLIGLVLFRLVSDSSLPANENYYINDFELHIAEANGDVETELPPLDRAEHVGKFGFPSLALVKVANDHPNLVSNKQEVPVVVHFDTETFELRYDTWNVTLKKIKDDAIKRRTETGNIPRHRILDYSIEKYSTPTEPLSEKETLRSCGVTEFYLIRLNSIRSQSSAPNFHDAQKPKNVASFTSDNVADGCHFYSVQYCHRFRPAENVRLAIYNDRVEVIGVERKLNAAEKLLSKATSPLTRFTCPIESLAGGEIVESLKGDRSLFRIISRPLNSGDWKSHYFEAITATVEEIIQNLNIFCEKNGIRKEFLIRTPSSRKVSIFRKVRALDL